MPTRMTAGVSITRGRGSICFQTAMTFACWVSGSNRSPSSPRRAPPSCAKVTKVPSTNATPPARPAASVRWIEGLGCMAFLLLSASRYCGRRLRRRRALAGAACRLGVSKQHQQRLPQFGASLALAPAEGDQALLLQLEHRRLSGGDDLDAGVGDMELDRAGVGRVAGALHQPGALQRADELGHVHGPPPCESPYREASTAYCAEVSPSEASARSSSARHRSVRCQTRYPIEGGGMSVGVGMADTIHVDCQLV